MAKVPRLENVESQKYQIALLIFEAFAVFEVFVLWPLTHVHAPVVYVKEVLPFALDVSLENSKDLGFTLWITIFFLCSQFLTLFHVIYSLNRLLFLSLETLKSIIRTDQHIVLELVNLFCVNGLAKMLNFPTRIHNSDSPFLALLDLLLFSIF